MPTLHRQMMHLSMLILVPHEMRLAVELAHTSNIAHTAATGRRCHSVIYICFWPQGCACCDHRLLREPSIANPAMIMRMLSTATPCVCSRVLTSF
jgi:hypothetical protein